MSQIDPRTIKKVIARHPFFPREKNIWSPSPNESLLQPNTQLPVLSFPCSFYLWLASCQLASACRQLAMCSPIHLDLSFEVSFFTCVLTSSSFFRSCQYIGNILASSWSMVFSSHPQGKGTDGFCFYTMLEKYNHINAANLHLSIVYSKKKLGHKMTAN